MQAFAVLRNRAFLRLWLGTHLVVGGAQSTRIALILYVVQSQGSVPDLAILIVMETVPGVLAAPFTGALVDRYRKCNLMLLANLGRLGLVVLLLAAPGYWMMCFVAGCQSILLILFQPARAAVVPLMMSGNEVVKANGADQVASNIVLILAPVLGAELLLLASLKGALVMEAAFLILGTLLIAGIRLGETIDRPNEQKASSLVSDVRESWHYLAHNRLLLHLVVLFFIGVFCNGMWMPIAPFLLAELGASERLLGWQLGILGVGAAIGALIAPRAVERYGKGPMVFSGLLAEGVAIAVYAMAPNAIGSGVAIFFWGIVVSIIVVPLYSLWQERADKQMLGRVFALVRQAENCATILAVPAAAALAASIGARNALLLAGLSYAVLIAASGATQRGRELLASR